MRAHSTEDGLGFPCGAAKGTGAVEIVVWCAGKSSDYSPALRDFTRESMDSKEVPMCRGPGKLMSLLRGGHPLFFLGLSPSSSSPAILPSCALLSICPVVPCPVMLCSLPVGLAIRPKSVSQGTWSVSQKVGTLLLCLEHMVSPHEWWRAPHVITLAPLQSIEYIAPLLWLVRAVASV